MSNNVTFHSLVTGHDSDADSFTNSELQVINTDWLRNQKRKKSAATKRLQPRAQRSGPSRSSINPSELKASFN